MIGIILFLIVGYIAFQIGARVLGFFLLAKHYQNEENK